MSGSRVIHSHARETLIETTPIQFQPHRGEEPIEGIQRSPRDGSAATQRHHWRTASREALRTHQLLRLNELLSRAVSEQPFYRDRFASVRLPLESLDELGCLPLLSKSELTRSGVVPICGLPAARYVRLHQTSGTSGEPLRILDTQEDWQWWLDTWQYVLDAADISSSDVAFMAFSYGPFIGFWTAHESLVARGAMVIAGGGMPSVTRLHAIAGCSATVLCCTPTYALHLAATAAEHGLNPANSTVSRIIVAGEPGGSVPEVRDQIESAWNATVIDHCGATEIGPWGVGSREGKGLHVIESEFIAETIVFDDSSPRGRHSAEGELAELVITGLGRHGAPAIRYRTGDLVRARASEDPQNRFLFLDGGILGRGDDMIVIRGVNIFPSTIEAIVRATSATAEFRVTHICGEGLAELRVEVEGTEPLADQLRSAFREKLGLRVDVQPVSLDSLPRFEAKSRRWVYQRGSR